MVEIMKEEEQKKEDTDKNNLSVISKAVEEGRAEQLDLLLQVGECAIMEAVRDSKTELAILMIKSGASFRNTRHRNGM